MFICSTCGGSSLAMAGRETEDDTRLRTCFVRTIHYYLSTLPLPSRAIRSPNTPIG